MPILLFKLQKIMQMIYKWDKFYGFDKKRYMIYFPHYKTCICFKNYIIQFFLMICRNFNFDV